MYKIMIIDDDPTSLAIMRALLEDKYEISTARSGHQALGSLEDGPIPDLILLDMMMPGLDGMEVLNILKKSEKFSHIPVIFITSECRTEDQIQSYAIGAADFLEKPVNSDMLDIKIHQQLHFLELERELQRLREGFQVLKDQFDRIFPASETTYPS